MIPSIKKMLGMVGPAQEAAVPRVVEKKVDRSKEVHSQLMHEKTFLPSLVTRCFNVEDGSNYDTRLSNMLNTFINKIVEIFGEEYSKVNLNTGVDSLNVFNNDVLAALKSLINNFGQQVKHELIDYSKDDGSYYLDKNSKSFLNYQALVEAAENLDVNTKLIASTLNNFINTLIKLKI